MILFADRGWLMNKRSGFGTAIGLLAFTASASIVQAQDAPRSMEEMREIFDRGCGDDNGTDRCDGAVQERMRELYGIEPPEALLAKGATIRRAMFVDGYGNDVAAITFAYPLAPRPTSRSALPIVGARMRLPR